MTISWAYMPILKWKQGERIALRNHSTAQWEGMVPLIELLDLGVGADSAAVRAAIPSAVKKIGQQLSNDIAADRPVAIDVRWMATSMPRQDKLLVAVVRALRKELGLVILPVISGDWFEGGNSPDLSDFDGEEVVLRLSTRTIEHSQLPAVVKAATAAGLNRKRLHLLLDQRSLVNESHTAAAAAAATLVAPAMSSACASVTLAGGSFPLNLIGFKQGHHNLPRVEWLVWQRLQSPHPSLRYADYTVTNPAPIPEMDPTQVNPSVAIRYAGKTFWRLFKARGFKQGPPNQYRTLCNLLLTDSVYSGSAFSYGDACYDKAAKGQLGNGNPSSWRRDATSHHLVLTLSQVREQLAATSKP